MRHEQHNRLEITNSKAVNKSAICLMSAGFRFNENWLILYELIKYCGFNQLRCNCLLIKAMYRCAEFLMKKCFG